MCKIASQLLHEYRKLNLVVYGKILYVVKIKADFSYTITKNQSRLLISTLIFLINNSGFYYIDIAKMPINKPKIFPIAVIRP